MYKVINETILKVIVLLSLFIIIIFLGFTGSLFHLGEYDELYMFLHKSAGVLLVVLTFIHILMKKNKVKKISEEFISLLFNKNVKHSSNKEELLEIIKGNSLEELALLFNIEIKNLLLTLEQNSIEVESPRQKLNKLAKSNSKDAYQIFILILKEHAHISQPLKG